MEQTKRIPKEMIFQWCRDGKHDKCRTQYGGDRIICSCDCGEGHGSNYEPIHKRMTEEEVRSSIDSINMIMTGDAGDGMSIGNRALMDTSPIWGDQVRDGNKTNSYANKGSSVSKYNYTSYYKEVEDASSLDELEARRSKPVIVGTGLSASGTAYTYGDYPGFDAAL